MIHRIDSPASRRAFSILFSIAWLLLPALPVAATDKTDVMATVRHFVDSFNKGDVKAIAATCADHASILDEFAPYEWHGSGACAKWTDDFDADAKRNGITDTVVSISTPRHVDTAGDRAYVVVPANYKFKQHGKPVQELGSTLTVALQKTDGHWRITGWAWAKR